MMPRLSLIPPGWRWTLAVLLCAALAGFCFHKGQSSVQTKWDREKDKQQTKTEQVHADQAEATVRVVTRYVTRREQQAQADQTILQEIPNHVQADTPDLPAGFRLLHDAAATGHPVVSNGAADAAPVPAQDLARTLAENYATCRQQAEQLSALQFWVLTQQRIEAGRDE